MPPGEKVSRGPKQAHDLQQIALLIARGEEPDIYITPWKSFVADLATSGDPIDVEQLVQEVLRQSFLEANKDLQTYMAMVKAFNQAKEKTREIRDTFQPFEDQIKGLEEKTDSAGDDAQLANVDLQDKLQKQQQTLQMMSDISKLLHDTAMAVIRKIGG